MKEGYLIEIRKGSWAFSRFKGRRGILVFIELSRQLPYYVKMDGVDFMLSFTEGDLLPVSPLELLAEI